MKSNDHISGFDGLRAIAVGLVFAFHLGIPGFSLGWIGVNLFFVLSGFLITRILVQTRGREDYFKRFYIRRSLRIFPIYYLSFLAILTLAVLRGWKISDWPYYLFYLQNWLLGISAFSPVFPSEFAHTWSLANEEQFYLLWPLVVRYCSPRALYGVLFALIMVGPISRYFAMAYTGNPFMAFSPLTSIVDPLAWGGAAAVFSERADGAKPTNNPMCLLMLSGGLLLALVFMVAAHGLGNFWHPHDHLLQVSTGVVFFALLGPLFASLLLLVRWHPEVAGPFLNLKPLVYVGRISYGLYLYHWPIFLLLDKYGWRLFPAFSPSAMIPLKCLLTAVVAVLSFELLEQPLLKLKERWTV